MLRLIFCGKDQTLECPKKCGSNIGINDFTNLYFHNCKFMVFSQKKDDEIKLHHDPDADDGCRSLPKEGLIYRKFDDSKGKLGSLIEYDMLVVFCFPNE